MPKKSEVPMEDAHSRADSGFRLGVPGKFSPLALDSQTLPELGEYRRMFKNATKTCGVSAIYKHPI